MCPSLMCELFHVLKELAMERFPHNQEVRYSVISGFIFLRFFAPAILGPRLFDLTTQQIVSFSSLELCHYCIVRIVIRNKIEGVGKSFFSFSLTN